MSVVVHDEMSLDLALRLLWREATREGVMEKLEEKRYFIPKTFTKHQKTKIWAKTKKRRRQASRKLKI